MPKKKKRGKNKFQDFEDEPAPAETPAEPKFLQATGDNEFDNPVGPATKKKKKRKKNRFTGFEDEGMESPVEMAETDSDSEFGGKTNKKLKKKAKKGRGKGKSDGGDAMLDDKVMMERMRAEEAKKKETAKEREKYARQKKAKPKQKKGFAAISFADLGESESDHEAPSPSPTPTPTPEPVKEPTPPPKKKSKSPMPKGKKGRRNKKKNKKEKKKQEDEDLDALLNEFKSETVSAAASPKAAPKEEKKEEAPKKKAAEVAKTATKKKACPAWVRELDEDTFESVEMVLEKFTAKKSREVVVARIQAIADELSEEQAEEAYDLFQAGIFTQEEPEEPPAEAGPPAWLRELDEDDFDSIEMVLTKFSKKKSKEVCVARVQAIAEELTEAQAIEAYDLFLAGKLTQEGPEDEPEEAGPPQWLKDFDEDDFNMLEMLLAKSKKKKHAREVAVKKILASLGDELSKEQANEAYDLFEADKLTQGEPSEEDLKKKAEAEARQKEAEAKRKEEEERAQKLKDAEADAKKRAAEKKRQKQKQKKEEKKRREKVKKMKPKIKQAGDRLVDLKNTLLASMEKDLIAFIESGENEFSIDYKQLLVDKVDPFVKDLRDASASLDDAVKAEDSAEWKAAEEKAAAFEVNSKGYLKMRKEIEELWTKIIKDIYTAKEEEEMRQKEILRKKEEEEKRIAAEKAAKKAEKRRLAKKNKRAKGGPSRTVGGIAPGPPPPRPAGRGRGKKGKKKGKKSKFELDREREQQMEEERLRVEAERKQREEEERKQKEAEELEKKKKEEEKQRKEAARKAALAKKRAEESDDSLDLDSDVDGGDEWGSEKFSDGSDDVDDFDDDNSNSANEFDDESDDENEKTSLEKPAAAPAKDQPRETDNKEEEAPQNGAADSKEGESPPQEERASRVIYERPGGKKGKKGKKKKKKLTEAEKRAKRAKQMKNLRAPIGCIMGHVDAGKTLILDNIRKSKVQEGETGGITQQIGASFLPQERLKSYLDLCKDTFPGLVFHLPGVLMIDTPGHEAFHNMRSRGSTLCNIAIVAVDINDARREKLQPQTIESLRLLKDRGTPFVIAMNKVDLVVGWENPERMKSGDYEMRSFETALKMQTKETQEYVEDYLTKLKVRFAQEGFNTELYTRNKKKTQEYSIVPCSAFTGEGIPDLMCLISELTQNYMRKELQFVSDQVEASVLEVNKQEGLGNVVDVILANGELREGDEIVLSGVEAPIHTKIKALLLPAEHGQEMRVKGNFKQVPQVMAAQGIRILGNGLDKAMSGSSILVVPRGLRKMEKEDVIEQMMDSVCGDFNSMIHEYVDKTGVGVHVQANTLGAMEALLEFICKRAEIPVSSIRIGAISKKDVMKANVMNDKAHPEYACILSFMVKVPPDVDQLAEQMGVKIFKSEIIYHLEEMFKDYMTEIREAMIDSTKSEAIFPCDLEILPDHVYRTRSPMVMGVKVVRGLVKVGTPVCSMKLGPNREPTPLRIGVIESIKATVNGEEKDVETSKPGTEVCIKIVVDNTVNLMYGRQFDHKNHLVSVITRGSLDTWKKIYIKDFKDDKEMIKLCLDLKRYFKIM